MRHGDIAPTEGSRHFAHRACASRSAGLLGCVVLQLFLYLRPGAVRRPLPGRMAALFLARALLRDARRLAAVAAVLRGLAVALPAAGRPDRRALAARRSSRDPRAQPVPQPDRPRGAALPRHPPRLLVRRHLRAHGHRLRQPVLRHPCARIAGGPFVSLALLVLVPALFAWWAWRQLRRRAADRARPPVAGRRAWSSRSSRCSRRPTAGAWRPASSACARSSR